MKYCCVLSTAPSLKEARKLSRILISNKTVACINLIPSVESHYCWKGKKEKSKEVLLVIKTKSSLLKRLEKILLKNHSYTLPEFIALPIVKGSKRYLKWLSAELS